MAKGWNGLIIQQNNNEEIDLLNLVEKKPEKYPFFLESSSRGNVLNRYSIIFYKPKILLEKKIVKLISLMNLIIFGIKIKLSKSR